MRYILLILLLFSSCSRERQIKDNKLIIGDGSSNEVKLSVDLGSTPLPYISFDSSDGNWYISQDGVSKLPLGYFTASSSNKGLVTHLGNVSAGSASLNGQLLTVEKIPKFATPSDINTIAIQSDGKILVGGSFLSYDGIANRNNLLRFNQDGTLDTAFVSNAVDGGKFGGSVNSIAIQPDSKIVVAGTFIDYNGVSDRNRLVRLNSDGTLDTTFTSNASDGNKINNTVFDIELQSDGKILVGGSFTDYNSVSNRNRFIRLNSDGTLDTTFVANSTDGGKFGNQAVRDIAIQSDGKILLGGGFADYDGEALRNRFIRLNSDGTLDTTFTSNASDGNKFNALVLSIAVQNDGKILVGGNVDGYGSVTGRNRLVRLNSDGTLDTTFVNNAVDGAKFNNNVNAINIQSDGKILVGGSFLNYDSVTGRDHLVRLNSDGTLDTTFVNNAVDGTKFVGGISFLNVQNDGKILVGGSFSNYNNEFSRNSLIRLNSDGTSDDQFISNASDFIGDTGIALKPRLAGAEYNFTTTSTITSGSGTINFPSNAKKVIFFYCGGGGGGRNGTSVQGTGGRAGQNRVCVINNPTSIAYQVGSGGTAGNSGNATNIVGCTSAAGGGSVDDGDRLNARNLGSPRLEIPSNSSLSPTDILLPYFAHTRRYTSLGSISGSGGVPSDPYNIIGVSYTFTSTAVTSGIPPAAGACGGGGGGGTFSNGGAGTAGRIVYRTFFN